MKIIEIKQTLKNLEQNSNCIKRKVAAFILGKPEIWGCNKIHQQAHYIASQNCLLCMQCTNSDVRRANNITCMALHAEIDCLTKLGINSLYRILCVSYTPCIECCKAIISTGIEQVIIAEPSKHHEKIKNLLRNCGINVIDLWELDDSIDITDLQEACL